VTLNGDDGHQASVKVSCIGLDLGLVGPGLVNISAAGLTQRSRKSFTYKHILVVAFRYALYKYKNVLTRSLTNIVYVNDRVYKKVNARLYKASRENDKIAKIL